MKKLLKIFLFSSLSLSITACEEGVFGPRTRSCLETQQTNENGASISREYTDNQISAIRYTNNGTPLYSYEFSYGAEGRITESQYIDDANWTMGARTTISYNEKGKWAKSSVTHPNGSVTAQTAQYDNLDQLKTLTFTSTSASGVTTVSATYTYEWNGGNNTRLTYTAPNQQQVITYTFDLAKENKRQKQQEKVAFMSPTVAYNNNMLQQTTTTTTLSGTTTETRSDYHFEYNQEGFPTRLTRTTTGASGNSSTTTTDFYYDCD